VSFDITNLIGTNIFIMVVDKNNVKRTCDLLVGSGWAIK